MVVIDTVSQMDGRDLHIMISLFTS